MPGTDRECIVPSFDQYHYVPVLYARAAETKSVAHLPAELSDALTPIWVIPPISTDARSGQPTKSLDQHIADVGRSLQRTWGEAPAFFDVSQLCESEGNPPGLATAVLAALDAERLQIVPVIRDVMSTEQRGEVARFAAQHDRDVCLRVSAAIWPDIGSATGDAAFADLVAIAEAAPSSVHLVIDVGDQVSDPPNVSIAAVRGSMALLENASQWRSLTLLGTSMPATTADVGRNNASELPRSEWAMWKGLRDSRGRRMSFGDYAIQSIDAMSTFNPLTMQSAAQLRYTVSTSWYVARGSGTRTAGFDQAHTLAAQIVRHSEFAGRDFSAGDNWIADCAVRATGTGNATTWRFATTNHHLVFVLKQLANLRGS